MGAVLPHLRYNNVYPLGEAFDLDHLWTGGHFDVKDPVNGPDDGEYFIEVLVNSNFSTAEKCVFQIATDKSAAADRKYRVYNGSVWSPWCSFSALADSADVSYDHTVSGLTATNVQDALDELKALVDTKADA